jgi:hypothetical protein
MVAVAKVAEELLKGMYTYVGSDVHHEKHIEAFSQNKSEDTTHFKKCANNQFFKGNTIFSKQKRPKGYTLGLFFKKACYLSNNSKWNSYF